MPTFVEKKSNWPSASFPRSSARRTRTRSFTSRTLSGLSLLLIVCAEGLIKAAEEGIPRRIINRGIGLAGAMTGGLTFGVCHRLHDIDPVVSMIFAVTVALETMLAGLCIRDWRGW